MRSGASGVWAVVSFCRRPSVALRGWRIPEEGMGEVAGFGRLPEEGMGERRRGG